MSHITVVLSHLQTRLEKVDGISEEPGNNSGGSAGHHHVKRAERLARIFSASHGLVACEIETKGRNFSGDSDV